MLVIAANQIEITQACFQKLAHAGALAKAWKLVIAWTAAAALSCPCPSGCSSICLMLGFVVQLLGKVRM